MSFYETPLFVDLLLGTLYVLIAAALLLVVWSAVRSLKTQRTATTLGKGKVNAPLRWLPWGVAVLVTLTMGVAWLLADTRPMSIGGARYSNERWLRISDMFITTSMVLMVVAVAGVALRYVIHNKGNHVSANKEEGARA